MALRIRWASNKKNVHFKGAFFYPGDIKDFFTRYGDSQLEFRHWGAWDNKSQVSEKFGICGETFSHQ